MQHQAGDDGPAADAAGNGGDLAGDPDDVAGSTEDGASELVAGVAAQSFERRLEFLLLLGELLFLGRLGGEFVEFPGGP